jgi:hypothetical protein
MATTADHKNVRPYTIVEARSSAAKLMRWYDADYPAHPRFVRKIVILRRIKRIVPVFPFSMQCGSALS